MIPLALFYPEGHQAHAVAGHPERPARVEAIREALESAGFWQPEALHAPLDLPVDLLQAVHTPAYLEALQAACAMGRWLDADTYTTPASWELALQAAGGALAVARAVWQREARYGFALTRPPGHHAMPARGMGFCLLNNVALAAEYLLRYQGAQRVAILDFDLHHGNGTQAIFYRRAEVCYLSTHQFPHYPGTGRLEETGAEAGAWTTANLPWPPHSGDRAFAAALSDWVLPLLDRWVPEVVLVSLGFDAHWRDPLGSLLLSGNGYAKIARALATWTESRAHGRLAFFLEGGYDLDAARACALAVVSALHNAPFQDPLGPSPQPESPAWQAVLQQARRLWQLD